MITPIGSEVMHLEETISGTMESSVMEIEATEEEGKTIEDGLEVEET